MFGTIRILNLAIEVESVPNRGTTVRFTLLVRQLGPTAPQPEEELVT